MNRPLNLAGEEQRGRRDSLDSRRSSVGERQNSSPISSSSFVPLSEARASRSGEQKAALPPQEDATPINQFSDEELAQHGAVPFRGQNQVVQIAPRYPFHQCASRLISLHLLKVSTPTGWHHPFNIFLSLFSLET